MSQLPPASRDEVEELLGEVDGSYVDRVLDTGASLDEISEAIMDLEEPRSEPRGIPSSVRVVNVREILGELVNTTTTPRTFPLRGVPLGAPI